MVISLGQTCYRYISRILINPPYPTAHKSLNKRAMDLLENEPTLLEMVETMVQAGSMHVKLNLSDSLRSRVICVGKQLLPCVYDAWATNTYPVFPRLQDVLAGQCLQVEALIRQAYAVGADLGYRLPNPSPDGKKHYPAWNSYPRQTFELWEEAVHVRVFSVDHPVQKPLAANHEEIFAAICANFVGAEPGNADGDICVELL